MNAKWSVLALFQGSASRVTAVDFCDVLVQRFWPRTTFELSWFDWEELLDVSTADSAARTAREADLLLVASARKGILEQHIRRWLETSLHKRGEREGILAGLCAPETSVSPESSASEQYLRKLAHQNGLDFLTGVPTSLSQSVPENAEAYTLRATKVTSVLDTILHQIPPPPRVF
jgi:hypothetical protein